MVWQGKFDTLFIGGEWQPPKSSQTADVISPATEQVLATVASASKEDIDAAVTSARHAFDNGPWPKMAIEERIAIVERLKGEFEKRRDEVAKAITDEMGSPITFSRNMQANVPILMISSFIDIARNYPLRELRRSATGNGLFVREPKGVVAAIVPWNVPMMTTMMKLAPSLLMGCCTIIKPASSTPISAYLLGEMLEAAGVPKGVVSIVPADREVSEYLALHPGVDKVTFTGSTAAGKRLASLCGELVRPITLELGGKSAAIFLDDADVAQAVEALRQGSLRNSGQVCSLKTRILVSKNRASEVTEAFAALLDSMPVGDPYLDATQIGPMATSGHRAVVENYIGIGIAEGARIVRGGTGMPAGLDRGWYVKPSLFAEVAPSSRLAQEEVFGPVLTISTYDSEDEAVQIANNSIYGLNGAIFSSDIEKAISIAGQIKTGTVEINGGGVGFHCPIGGVKMSGIGREAGPEGFDPYTEIKTIGLPRAYAETLSI
jgi:betaine-aldehyde dehydrogenase